MAKKPKRPPKRKQAPPREREHDPPVSLHPMKFTEAVEALLKAPPTKKQ